MHNTALLLSLLVLVGCSQDPNVAPEPVAASAAPVVTPIAEAPLLGVVASRVTEIVAAQVDGRIVRVSARSGQRVRAGDPIVELDPTLFNDRLRAAQAAADAARAELGGAGAEVSEARRRLALERRLVSAGATAEETVRIAAASLSRAGSNAARASAALREAQATVASLKTQLGQTQIHAPIDGVVSLVKAQPGEVIAPGTPVARVFDPENLMIRFQVPRDRRHALTTGTVVELTIAGGPPVRAVVTSVSSDLEPPLDFAVAEADLQAAAGGDLQIGALGEVRIAAL